MHTESELKLKAKLLTIRSSLRQDDAEHLVRLAKGSDVLLNECLELEKSGVGFSYISEWLEAKTGQKETGSQAYSFCEAVLNLALVGNRNANKKPRAI
ncbi:hypothetical protein [Leptolyngbya sp. FACHB-8]|uniref:hypothetical protein n=1 Tax=unclassified Leptolyngbya TaxID=2650499 RepID=UPI0016827473|nr:hypothetical protein [Leptolyngbya sp. FACHB-8]MBD1911255.1 hypothetical protein [Leptolyngbya sp. FACHB-8]